MYPLKIFGVGFCEFFFDMWSRKELSPPLYRSYTCQIINQVMANGIVCFFLFRFWNGFAIFNGIVCFFLSRSCNGFAINIYEAAVLIIVATTSDAHWSRIDISGLRTYGLQFFLRNSRVSAILGKNFSIKGNDFGKLSICHWFWNFLACGAFICLRTWRLLKLTIAHDWKQTPYKNHDELSLKLYASKNNYTSNGRKFCNSL